MMPQNSSKLTQKTICLIAFNCGSLYLSTDQMNVFEVVFQRGWNDSTSREHANYYFTKSVRWSGLIFDYLPKVCRGAPLKFCLFGSHKTVWRRDDLFEADVNNWFDYKNLNCCELGHRRTFGHNFSGRVSISIISSNIQRAEQKPRRQIKHNLVSHLPVTIFHRAFV